MEKVQFTFEFRKVELTTVEPITKRQMNSLIRSMGGWRSDDLAIVSAIPVEVPDEPETESAEGDEG